MDSSEDFLKKILGPQAALPPVPMRMPASMPMEEEIDPADMLPAIEEVDESPEEEAAAQAQYKLKPGNANGVVTMGERAEVAAAEPTESEDEILDLDANNVARLDQEFSDSDALQSPYEAMGMPEDSRMPAAVDESPLARKQSLMSTYQQLVNAQKANQGNMRNIGILGGASKMAQGFATGQGAKIDANETGIKQLMEQSAQPVLDIKDRIKLGGDEMNSPTSDISIFMREQAYAVLKKLNPESNYANKLDGMSAEQLQKLPGMKNVLADQKIRADWVATDRVLSDGTPVKFNKQTGTYVNGFNNEPVQASQTTVRDIARKDDLTGQYGYVNRGSGMQIMSTNYGAAQVQPQAMGKSADGKEQTPEVSMAQISKAAPKIADELSKKQKEYIADMKDSREVATSVTNLANKLANGDSKGVDSGMLGGIQTQAAKMAGQKGVLTDQDLVKFAGAGGFMAAADRAVANAALGEMSDKDIEFFKLFSSKMGHSLDQDIANRTQIHTRQTQGMLSAIAPGITEANVNKLLGADVVAPIVQDKSAKSTSNTVKVQGPSGQIAPMTKENAEKYLSKPGYKLVK